MRKVLKWLAAGTAGLVLAVGAYGVWDTYQRYRTELSEYKDMPLGASAAEVRYAWGIPAIVLNEVKPGDPNYDPIFAGSLEVNFTDRNRPDGRSIMPADKNIEDYQFWRFGPIETYLMTEFDKPGGSVIRLSCYTRGEDAAFSLRCGRTYGFYGDGEQEFVEHFGTPTNSSIDAPSGVKTIKWNTLGLEVQFQQRRAYRVMRTTPKDPNAVAFLWNWYF